MLKPIILLSLVSILLSFIFADTVLGYCKYFLFFSILQILFYNIYKNILEFIAMRLQIEKIKEFSKQGMEVKCPCYLEKKMFLPINLNLCNFYFTYT